MMSKKKTRMNKHKDKTYQQTHNEQTKNKCTNKHKQTNKQERTHDLLIYCKSQTKFLEVVLVLLWGERKHL